MKAGWRGLFAIEVAKDAYKSLAHNLIEPYPISRHGYRFDWPDWLERKPYDIRNFIKKYRPRLKELRGTIQLVTGGPPCQGFSFAGRRDQGDHRNELFKYYLDIVDLLSPEFVLMENVQGISVIHGISRERRLGKRQSYSERIRRRLERHGFEVQQHVIRAMDFGVPQIRPRYFTLGIRRDLLSQDSSVDFYRVLFGIRKEFLQGLGLPVSRPVSVHNAISDLETSGKLLVPCLDSESPGYMQIKYSGPRTKYQRLMHENSNHRPINSLRLIRHREETVAKFKRILRTCRKGVELSDSDRKKLGISKLAITPLAPDKPSHTLTTLPDDFLHYAEPRIHTVREYARLQSFPDWFEFQGKYSTGGNRRAHECPRYSQVGNAVPPLLAEALGKALRKVDQELIKKKAVNHSPKSVSYPTIDKGQTYGSKKLK